MLLKPGCPPLGALARARAGAAPARLAAEPGKAVDHMDKERQMEQARRAVLRVSQGWVAPARREAAVTPKAAAPRTAPTEADQAEALIMDWYHWTRGYRPKLGVGRIAAFARGMVPDDAYVDSEDVDARLNAARCQQVDLCIDELPWQQRAAIGVHAGNKAAGAACSAIRACRRKRSMPPTWTRARLVAGAAPARAAGRWPCATRRSPKRL
ncbi:hypothetical protein WJ970_00660 [Achromobacter xylosoxidans]